KLSITHTPHNDWAPRVTTLSVQLTLEGDFLQACFSGAVHRIPEKPRPIVCNGQKIRRVCRCANFRCHPGADVPRG
ncbi:MAG TPA: hypothetical protein VJ323_09640, partial [Bryobacteraceae bacterium]|nr:hypothetical protein [Bryobacteraceae bacterium]